MLTKLKEKKKDAFPRNLRALPGLVLFLRDRPANLGCIWILAIHVVLYLGAVRAFEVVYRRFWRRTREFSMAGSPGPGRRRLIFHKNPKPRVRRFYFLRPRYFIF